MKTKAKLRAENDRLTRELSELKLRNQTLHVENEARRAENESLKGQQVNIVNGLNGIAGLATGLAEGTVTVTVEHLDDDNDKTLFKAHGYIQGDGEDA